MVSLFEKEGIEHPRLDISEMLILPSGSIKARPYINLGAEQSKEQNSMVFQIIKWIEP